ncbi:coa transferase caib/baif family protein [Labrys miyagiensis]|uniref:Coa transferase caib/baif family protein n=1 Tax=Labrys miyagiensis TaxID=346912 RepID=A0ABQ6CJJ1_9HYPH|nr:CoA transferase [Labrys miyagiensis]GLS20379.1 coa transferase caib/baif family protein [Labrys miyagiensis]
MAQSFLNEMWQAVGGSEALLDSVTVTGRGQLPSAFKVSDFATAAIAASGLALAELSGNATGAPARVTVDRRLASFWFLWSLRPVGWTMPAPWDPIAGDYEAKDGWIRLHTNAPQHREAAQRVLGEHNDKDTMAAAVRGWAKGALEQAIVAAGGCAAEMRSLPQWQQHEQGSAVASEPLVLRDTCLRGSELDWRPEPGRPLKGLRVLDLTRVLAGPVATRFLAGFGAEVLRIDPPDWDEPAVVPEVTLGKQCARLDLMRPQDRAVFEELLSGADILVHGYRADALAALGYDEARRQSLSPGLIDVSLDAYGWSGPWRDRRGFDSLVQMSGGIADAGMAWKQADRPVPLPAQALDHATGYLMAAAAIRGITERLTRREVVRSRLSLARMAKLLADAGPAEDQLTLAPETEDDQAAAIEKTFWGEAKRLRPPIAIDGIDMAWDKPATPLGSAPARWA